MNQQHNICFTHSIATRLVAVLLSLALVCSMAACAAKPNDATQSDNNATNSGASGASSATGQSGSQLELSRYSMVFYEYFDTVTTIIAYCETKDEFDAQMQAIEAELAYYNTLFDIYNTYDGVTNLATVNATAATEPVVVDAEIINLLLEAKEMYQLTDGKVNVAMGSVFRLWHDERDWASINPDAAKLPDGGALRDAAAHTNLDDVILDETASTVFFADPQLQLDVGSCGKGYACEMIAQNAAARGATSMLMSLGGNLRGIGTKPDGSPWVGGVEDPWAMAKGETASLVSIQVTDRSLVVSGDYQRFYYVGNEKYHHLIDPDTLYPANYFNSVSVITADAGLADCLSTALFCMSLEEGQAFIERLQDTEAMWCLPDGETVVYSSGFLEYEN